MGIVKFYQWITSRYPCVSRVIKYHEIPDFDNLYVDVNSIIYTCFDPEQEDCSENSEEKIFARIFQYLEVLFKFVRPKNLFFIAVDGVSPCAKTNSQRGGLFSSCCDDDDQEDTSVEPVFDTSSIKPGTQFMARLQECFKYFINKKLSTDPTWQNVEVILSGHNVPGEGEHKIMDYIRYQKAQPGYNPNTRHCVYGLDADLILLGLVTHEPHFTLLYEKFPFVKRKTIIPHTFYIMYFSLLREYIDAEFSSLKTSFPYNLEDVIDDFVLFGCLLGNDFIPPLPGMHAKQDILSILFKKYHDVLPSLQGYIHENGTLNMARFERYITALAKDNFDENTPEERLAYYNERMDMNEQDVDQLVESFVKGVQWILHYYYTGVPSWDWFYPYHYAPFVSDLKGFSSLQPVFELGKPFLAFEQMLACVPPTLAYHLPKPYQDLVTSKDSPVIEFYPTKFKQFSITNGKWDDPKAWIHTVLLPFIDKDQLLKAMEPFHDQLTDEEMERNACGSCLSYRYDHQKPPGHTYPSPCPSKFLDILNCKSSFTDLSSDPFPIKKEDMVFGLCEGVSLDLYFPQFPTFRHIPHTINNCNEDRRYTNPHHSYREYKCINIQPQGTAHHKMQTLTKNLIGKTCYVRWPYMTEARVSGLFNTATNYIYSRNKVSLKTALWKVQGVAKNCWEHQAITSSEPVVIVEVQEVQEVQGTQYGPQGYAQQWSRSYTYYPLQAIVMYKPGDALQQHQDELKTLAELFPKGDLCFLLKPESDLYGKQAKVTSVDMLNEKVYVKVQVEPKIEAAVYTTCQELETHYYPIDEVANRLGMNKGILSKIIGSLFCEEGSPTNEHLCSRFNIGLKLQYYKKELPGYTQWSARLSQAAECLVNEYKEKFPSVFRYLCEHQEGQSKYYESDLFPADISTDRDSGSDSGHGLEACLDWLKSLPTQEMELVDSHCLTLEQSQIEEVQSTIKRIIQIEPGQIFKPTDHQGGLIPDLEASYQLLDRVVNVSKNCAVPFGLRGTVIGISEGEPDNSSVYEVLYDEEFPGGLSIRGSMSSAYYHPPSCLINLTYGTTRMQQQARSHAWEHNDDRHVPPLRRRHDSYPSSQAEPYHHHRYAGETREERFPRRDEESWRKSSEHKKTQDDRDRQRRDYRPSRRDEDAYHSSQATRNEPHRPARRYDDQDSWRRRDYADRDRDRHESRAQRWRNEGENQRRGERDRRNTMPREQDQDRDDECWKKVHRHR